MKKAFILLVTVLLVSMTAAAYPAPERGYHTPAEYEMCGTVFWDSQSYIAGRVIVHSADLVIGPDVWAYLEDEGVFLAPYTTISRIKNFRFFVREGFRKYEPFDCTDPYSNLNESSYLSWLCVPGTSPELVGTWRDYDLYKIVIAGDWEVASDHSRTGVAVFLEDNKLLKAGTLIERGSTVFIAITKAGDNTGGGEGSNNKSGGGGCNTGLGISGFALKLALVLLPTKFFMHRK